MFYSILIFMYLFSIFWVVGVDFVFSFSKYGPHEWKVKVFGDIDILTITNTILTKYKRTLTLSAYEDSRRPQKKPVGVRINKD